MKLQRSDRGMRFLRQPRRPSEDEGLIPLINVIFLIMIFFMIAGHMEAAAPFRIDPPVSRTDTRPLPEELTLLLAADGRIAIGSEVLSLDTLDPWLQRWSQSAAGTSRSASLPTVSVKADGGVQARGLRSLLNALRRAGFSRVALLTDRAR
jgi:biopolymer transport protein ExbD